MFHLHINNVQNILSDASNGPDSVSVANGNSITATNNNNDNSTSTVLNSGLHASSSLSTKTTSTSSSPTTIVTSAQTTEDTVRFSIGRRNYEILSGTIRLFREDGITIESAMNQSCTLLIVAVPSRITTADLCHFLGPHLSHVEHIRIIKDTDHNGRFMVLLRMMNTEYSTQLFKSYNGRTFTSFDPELAHFLFVSQIRITSTFTTPSSLSSSLSTSSSLSVERLPPSLSTTGGSTKDNVSNVSLSRKSSIENELMTDGNSRNNEINDNNNKETYDALRAMNHSPPLPSDPLLVSTISNTNYFPSLDPSKAVHIENYVTNSRNGVSISSSSNNNTTNTDNLPPLIELPTCPVCLERLDSTVSGMLTTLCNHTFHCTCLAKWEDDTCPVCRFCLAEELSTDDEDIHNPHESVTSCEVCGVKPNLWLCLVCGHTGCGRYEGEHAIAHYRSSGHTYAIELSSQRVWDYTGDGYVHRLIHNKADGKVIELPDPISQYRYSSVSSPSSSLSHNNVLTTVNGAGTTRPRYAPDTDTVHGDITREKIDSIAFEYTLLLTHQLESQRTYFESMLTQLMSLIPSNDTERKKEAERILYLQHGLTRSQKIVHPPAQGTVSTLSGYVNNEHTNVHTHSSSRTRSSRTSSPLRANLGSSSNTTIRDDDDVNNNNDSSLVKYQEFENLNRKLQTRNTELEELIHTLQNRVSEAESKIFSLERERRNAVRQVGVWKDKVDDLSKELTFLKEVSNNQSANVKQWQTVVSTAENKEKIAVQQAQIRISELEEQVRDLMFTLDTQAKIMASDETVRNEVTNGQVLITENNTNSSTANSVRARLAKKAAARGINGSTGSSSSNTVSESPQRSFDAAVANADAIAAELLATEKDSLGKGVPLVRTNSSSGKQSGKKK